MSCYTDGLRLFSSRSLASSVTPPLGNLQIRKQLKRLDYSGESRIQLIHNWFNDNFSGGAEQAEFVFVPHLYHESSFVFCHLPLGLLKKVMAGIPRKPLFHRSSHLFKQKVRRRKSLQIEGSNWSVTPFFICINCRNCRWFFFCSKADFNWHLRMLGNKEWTGLSKIVSTYRRSTPTVTATGRGFLDGQFGNAVGLCQTGVSCAGLETRWIPHWSKTSCHSPDQTVWWKNFSGHLYEWHYDTLWKTVACFWYTCRVFQHFGNTHSTPQISTPIFSETRLEGCS